MRYSSCDTAQQEIPCQIVLKSIEIGRNSFYLKAFTYFTLDTHSIKNTIFLPNLIYSCKCIKL